MATSRGRTFSDVPISVIQEYWDRRPCNIRHSPRPVGTREYFDEVEARKYLVEPHIPGFAQFDAWTGKKVLEIGCGIGTDTIAFARGGAQVTAVDLSETSLGVAAQRARVYGLEERIRFLHGNAEELSRFLPEQDFDLVYCFGVIHHTPRPERILRQIRGYMRPDSLLKAMVYHRYSWKVASMLIRHGHGRLWRCDEVVARHSEAQRGSPVTYSYSRRQARQLLEGNGFQIRELAADHIFPYKIADYLQYRYLRVWHFRWLPRSWFRWLEAAFGWHLCITATPAPLEAEGW